MQRIDSKITGVEQYNIWRKKRDDKHYVCHYGAAFIIADKDDLFHLLVLKCFVDVEYQTMCLTSKSVVDSYIYPLLKLPT